MEWQWKKSSVRKAACIVLKSSKLTSVWTSSIFPKKIQNPQKYVSSCLFRSNSGSKLTALCLGNPNTWPRKKRAVYLLQGFGKISHNLEIMGKQEQCNSIVSSLWISSLSVDPNIACLVSTSLGILDLWEPMCDSPMHLKTILGCRMAAACSAGGHPLSQVFKLMCLLHCMCTAPHWNRVLTWQMEPVCCAKAQACGHVCICVRRYTPDLLFAVVMLRATL